VCVWGGEHPRTMETMIAILPMCVIGCTAKHAQKFQRSAHKHRPQRARFNISASPVSVLLKSETRSASLADGALTEAAAVRHTVHW
jgi:hypothetical protein